MMKIKICGLLHLDDAEHCAQLGIWALGFNFYAPSPRCISTTAAKEIMNALPKSILKVGIYMNESYDTLLRYFDDFGLDLVQVYAPLNDAPNSFKDRVILSLQAATKSELPPASILSSYRYLLLDAPKIDNNHLPGGTGRQANWALAETMAREYPLILAGGINATNVRDAIEAVNPYAVDLASGVEQRPGIKDKLEMNRLFEACKHDN
jgi:phosphoribosylanthranilate isomerase